MNDITELIIAIIEILAVVASALLIPYIKSKLSKERIAKIVKICEIACSAAEEAARAGLIQKENKPQYAIEIMREHGIRMDEEQVMDYIYSTCWKLFNQFKADESHRES